MVNALCKQLLLENNFIEKQILEVLNRALFQGRNTIIGIVKFGIITKKRKLSL